MDYSQALTEIKKGLIRPVYLLHGEETFLARQLEKAIVEAVLPDEDRDMSLTVLERDPQPAELANIIETVPFLGGKNVIILRGTGLFRAGKKGGEDEAGSQDKADDRLLKLMADMPEYSHVVFSAGEKADKRRKLFKAVEQYGAVVDLSPLKPKDVRPWITAKLTELGKKMAPDAMEHLLAAVSMMPQVSLGFLSGELDKTALYAAGQTITRRDVMAVMAAVPEVSVFTMIEAVSLKQTARALKLLDEQLSGGESPLRLLALLARQVRMLWQGKVLADRGLTGGEVANELGVPPFVGDKLVRQAYGFTQAKLKATIVALADADRDLKSGRADKFVLEKIIIEMCR